jgi:FlaA1/EpsC-like NDP-sugar epimerase
VEIVFTGVRPGEKLVEELSYPDDELASTAHPSISMSSRDVPEHWAIRRAIAELELLAEDGSREELATQLVELASLEPVTVGVH